MQFSQGAWFQLLLYQSKLEVCNKENKNQPHKHTHKRWTGWMPWGCWKGSSFFAAFWQSKGLSNEHVLQYLPFQIVWICASSLFPRLLSAVSSVKDKKECKELRSVERGHSRWFFHRWSFQHAVLATDAELTPAMAMCLQFRVGHVFQSKQSLCDHVHQSNLAWHCSHSRKHVHKMKLERSAQRQLQLPTLPWRLKDVQ